MEMSGPRLTDGQSWEHRLFPFLVAAFSLAAGATLASTPRIALVSSQSPVQGIRTAIFAPSLPPPADMVQMHIADVVLPDGTNNGVVLLIDGASRYVLPVFVPASASESIRTGLKVTTGSGSPDVLARMVAAFGGEVSRIEVRQGSEQPVESRIIVRNGDRELSIEALPAEALALAANVHTPVFAARAMLTNQGIRKEAVDHLPGGLPSHLRDPEQL